MRKIIISITFFASLSIINVASAGSTTPHWASIDWNNISLSADTGFQQSITINKKPMGAYNKTQVAWSLHVGNGEGRLTPFIEIFNHDLIVFGFHDVASDVRFSQSGKTKCSYSTPNFLSIAGTYQARCETPLNFQIGETYTYKVFPIKDSNIPGWKGELLIKSSGQIIDLGTIQFSVPQSILSNSQSMTGFNQIWNSGENAETLNNKDCPGLHNADVIFSTISLINSIQIANVTGNRQSPQCLNVKFNQSNSNIYVTYNNYETIVIPQPTLNPTPNVSATPNISEVFSNNSISAGTLNNLSFSLLKVINNKINIAVKFDKGSFDNIILISPDLSAAGTNKIAGRINGDSAVWELPFNSTFSGKTIPIRVVGIKDGIESQPIQTEMQLPITIKSNVIQSPSKLLSLRSEYIGSKLLVYGQISNESSGYPSEGFLYSPNLNISKNSPIQGEIVGNKIVFSVDINKKYLGKRVTYFVIMKNRIGNSPLNSGSVLLPKINQVNSINNVLVSCKKGSVIRTFQAKECPPGWTN